MPRRHSDGSWEHGEARSIKVLLVEDMDLLRTALVSLLSEEEDIEVIADLKCIPGLIDKNAPATQLLHAIRGVADGATMIDARLVITALSADQNPFTPREQLVLRLAAGGATGPEIAKRLSLSPGTVRNYLSNTMNKTGVRTRIDAIRIATESGWL